MSACTSPRQDRGLVAFMRPGGKALLAPAPGFSQLRRRSPIRMDCSLALRRGSERSPPSLRQGPLMKRYVLPLSVGLALLFGGTTAVRGPVQLGSSARAQSQANLGAASDPLQALSDRFEAIASRVAPAVVSVE